MCIFLLQQNTIEFSRKDEFEYIGGGGDLLYS